MLAGEALGLVIAQCALACRGDIPEDRLTRIPRDALTYMFLALSEVLTPKTHIAPNARPTIFPGYVAIDVGTLSAQIPFHLVDSFPLGAPLEHLINVAKLVKLDPESPICISGSSTFMGAAKFSSDVDFCEYSSASIDAISENAAKKVLEQQDSLACIRVWTAGTEINFPSASDCDKIRCGIHSKEPIRSTTSSWMLNYVGEVPTIGVMPISNLTLRVDPREPDSEAYKRSWAFQEVMIAPRGIAPRSLDHPIQLGRYVLWLMGEIEAYKQDKPIKALKRALSLARILQMDTESKQILDLLAAPTVVAAASMDAIHEVEQSLGGLMDEIQIAKLTDAVRRAREAQPKTLKQLTKKQLARMCQTRIKEFRGAVDKRFKRAERLAASYGKGSVRRKEAPVAT